MNQAAPNRSKAEEEHKVTDDSKPPVELPGERNLESYFVSRQEDRKDWVRPVHGIACCLLPKECSKSAWSRQAPWSLLDKWTSCSYMKYHLVHSVYHKMKEENAQALIEKAYEKKLNRAHRKHRHVWES